MPDALDCGSELHDGCDFVLLDPINTLYARLFTPMEQGVPRQCIPLRVNSNHGL